MRCYKLIFVFFLLLFLTVSGCSINDSKEQTVEKIIANSTWYEDGASPDNYDKIEFGDLNTTWHLTTYNLPCGGGDPIEEGSGEYTINGRRLEFTSPEFSGTLVYEIKSFSEEKVKLDRVSGENYTIFFKKDCNAL